MRPIVHLRSTAATALLLTFTLIPLVGVAQSLAQSASPDAGVGPSMSPTAFTDADHLIQRAMDAAHLLAYEARMTIISVDRDGPGITELDVRHAGDGQLQVENAESWLFDVSASEALLQGNSGDGVQIGDVRTLPFSLGEVRRNYDVTVDGRAALDDGSALVLAFRSDETLRERLYIGDETGLVIRRETYDLAGVIRRIVVLSDIDVVASDAHMARADAPATPDREAGLFGVRRQLPPQALAAADDTGWSIPTHLPGGYDLRASYALNVDAVQAVYSDGLYTISLLQQEGDLDHGSLRGAVAEQALGRHIHRWPGTEPERMVFTGGGRTYTVVSDAPRDVVAGAVADLPRETGQSLPQRLGRGLGRMASWVWPFG